MVLLRPKAPLNQEDEIKKGRKKRRSSVLSPDVDK
jgi:hypothetical protein